jgi:O-antigen ligase
VLCLAALAWAVAAFGAVYPWAYWPLAVMAVTSGAVAVLGTRDRSAALSPALRVGLALVAMAGLLQLIPLPVAILRHFSPNTFPLLQNLDFAVGAGVTNYHPISVRPASTAVAVALFGSFAMLLVGTARAFSVVGPRRFVEALTVLATLLALVGIIQKPLYDGAIYGFWEPLLGGNPFGPFVNKNHFAGWMLLALPLTLALLCAGLQRAMQGLREGWRYRLLWLSTPEANRLLLLAGAAIVMALALVLTMSRSGISALAVSLLLTGWAVLRGYGNSSRRVAAAAYLLLLVLTVVGWAGTDAVVTRFAKTDWSEFNNRRGAWADALGVWRSFPAFGTGLNTYGHVTLFYQRNNLDFHYEESHNDYLQVAAEGGLLVGGPALFCAVVLVRDVFRRLSEDRGTTSWWLRRGAVTALIAIALQEAVEFSLQIPANAALFAVVCAVALHTRGPKARGVSAEAAFRVAPPHR